MNFNLMDFFKLPSNIMSAILLASGMILFLPDEIIGKMYMIDFKNKYGFIIGVAFIISISILTIGFLISIYKFLYNKYSNFKFEKNSGKLLDSLDMYKKAIVYGLYKKDNNTAVLQLNDGAIVFLEHWMVIQKATNQYVVSNMMNPEFPYFLQPWVVEKLQNDENVLLSFKKAYKQQAGKMNF